MDSAYGKIWKIVLDTLSKTYSEVLMDLWFKRLELSFMDDKNVFLVIDESPELIDILNTNYAKKIEEAFSSALNLNLKVTIAQKGKYYQLYTGNQVSA